MKRKIRYSLLFTLAMFSAQLNFGQAPDFGSASNFSVFTGVGAFDNLGASNITGDIGTNAGAFTGFPPGTLIGNSYIADAVSLAASIDVGLAYVEMVIAECDTTIAPVMGSGQLLPPRIYCIPSAASLNGDLTLDGEGNANAVFIFKIDGAFSTSTFSNIILINSASLCNVYWQINGAFILGDASNFRGNLIAHGAISLLEGASYEGRCFSNVGAIDLHNNLIQIDPDGCNAVLPVELISFTANCVNQKAILKWYVVSEINNDYYFIERSNDGETWEQIEKVKSNNNGIKMGEYIYADESVLDNISYYRIKQTDLNGKSNILGLVSLENCQTSSLNYSIYPNPTNEILNILYDGNQVKNYSLAIYNMSDEKVYHSIKYEPIIDLSVFPEGIYLLFVHLNEKWIIEKISLRK